MWLLATIYEDIFASFKHVPSSYVDGDQRWCNGKEKKNVRNNTVFHQLLTHKSHTLSSTHIHMLIKLTTNKSINLEWCEATKLWPKKKKNNSKNCRIQSLNRAHMNLFFPHTLMSEIIEFQRQTLKIAKHWNIKTFKFSGQTPYHLTGLHFTFSIIRMVMITLFVLQLNYTNSMQSMPVDDSLI